MWDLLLKGRFGQYDNWCKFLLEKHNKPISKDTWLLLLEFSSQVVYCYCYFVAIYVIR